MKKSQQTKRVDMEIVKSTPSIMPLQSIYTHQEI